MINLDIETLSFLKALVFPPGGLILLLVLGVLFARYFLGKLMLTAGIFGLYLLSTPLVTALLAQGLEEQYPPMTVTSINESKAEAIVVFLAGMYGKSPELDGKHSLGPLSLERLSFAALLHRESGLPIILCGSGNSDQSVAETAAETLIKSFGLAPLAVETESKNTWENAQLVKPILERHGIKKIALVTHAFHMPRSMYSVQQAGIDAVAAPTHYYYQGIDFSKTGNWLPYSRELVKNHFLLHEYLGLLWYEYHYSNATSE